MLQALLAGVASIKAQQTRMNVIGNNLANVNTTAYKGSRVTFQDMIAQTIRGAARPTDSLGGTNPIQYGLGVLIGGTDVNNEQGSLN
ncbi:MAG: flagellar basal body protein, partial [Fimbriimonadales bacterium]